MQPPPLVPLAPGALLGRRFRIEGRLGAGGEGTVYAARDELLGGEVAVKLLPVAAGRASRSLRAHVAALRGVSIPGVPRLIAQGQGAEAAWIAMERVRGEPFGPRSAGRAEALRLVEGVARLHLAGLLHLDLKPDNVLVDAGRVWILDFGTVRSGPSRGDGAATGTPGWRAPEQVHGGPLGPWTDLYALGLLLRHALGPDAPGLDALLPRLLHRHVGARPRSARSVLTALGGQLGEPLGARWRPPGGDPPSLADLGRVVAGPEPFLHLPSDLAALLVGPSRAAVVARVRRLVASGRARWEDGTLRLDRGALVRSGRVPPVEVAEAEVLYAEGRLEQLEARLEVSVTRARPDPALLVLAVRTALALERGDALSRALVTLGSARRWSPQLDAAWALLVAWQAFRRGDDGPARLPRPAVGDEEVDAWGVALGLAVAERDGRLEAGLAATAGWATSQERRARLAGWTARLRYAEGRYAEAGALYEAAAAGRSARPGQISALANAANAWLEEGDLDRCVELAERAYAEADVVRLAGHAAQLWARARLARYRRGDPLLPLPDWAEAAGEVSPVLGAVLALNEAAVAWRTGQQGVGQGLAQRAVTLFSGLGNAPGLALARGLAQALGLRPAGDTVLAGPPEVQAQAAALVRIGGGAGWEAGRAQLSAWPARRRGRLDVLSAAECAAVLDAPPSPALAEPHPSGAGGLTLARPLH